MNDHAETPLTVNCPTCSKAVEWTDANSFRPFCSKRCQLIDLGAWASEEYRIPSAKPLGLDDELNEDAH